MIGFKILVTAGLLVIGGLLVLNQQMNIGQFVAAEIIILLVISSVDKLITGLESLWCINFFRENWSSCGYEIRAPNW